MAELKTTRPFASYISTAFLAEGSPAAVFGGSTEMLPQIFGCKCLLRGMMDLL